MMKIDLSFIFQVWIILLFHSQFGNCNLRASPSPCSALSIEHNVLRKALSVTLNRKIQVLRVKIITFKCSLSHQIQVTYFAVVLWLLESQWKAQKCALTISNIVLKVYMVSKFCLNSNLFNIIWVKVNNFSKTYI